MIRIRLSGPPRFGTLTLMLMLGVTAAATGIATAAPSQKSKPFSGVKVNGGSVTFTKVNGKNVLTLSDDFKVPDTPDPHWRVVDSKGTVYLLDRLKAKDDRYNKSITLPAYIHDVAKVQIWCAFAENVLGEASFEAPAK